MNNMRRLKGVSKKECLVIKVLEGDGDEEPYNISVYYVLLGEKGEKMKLLTVEDGCGLEVLDDGEL